MSKCKHELEMLVGIADGILCRRCGSLFKTFAELRADAGEPEEAAPTPAPVEEKAPEKPKRGRKGKNQE